MTRQILVPLKRHSVIEEIIPCLEEIVQPGMEVVFLIPYPVNGMYELIQDQWVKVESREEGALASRKIGQKYSWGAQRRLAQNLVLPAREALHKIGAEVTVDLYGDRLKRVMESYVAKGDVHLIMTEAGSGLSATRLLGWTASIFSMLKRPGYIPFLVLSRSH
jgi:hypothetical protein